MMSGGIWNPGQRLAIEVERLSSENEELKKKFREIESITSDPLSLSSRGRLLPSAVGNIQRICREALSKNEET